MRNIFLTFLLLFAAALMGQTAKPGTTARPKARMAPDTLNLAAAAASSRRRNRTGPTNTCAALSM
jgi:hypothetical protein